ncbi:LacI family DNA-binding transcriptional regulator [Rhizobium oryzicola]|uniref:LacI family DNA-binding transcriptional regulator n=1 Tax=Rhizobium oryzicola TaxID=1232668 RepID=A0ABT8SSG9_9HYPH|nr:LacI family DNA-binding transcriptional regulator [Rhizobium oryzicola]MDO1581368.1 LacI family DNA-binding transcriptional regulator [Rhizobium oryzicola]
MGVKRGRSERTTLVDVASRAGVSAITVSRVLREPEKVSSSLRQRILELIDDMGYVPDQAARALASRHNSTFGVLVPSLTNRAFISFMQGIEERVRDTHFRIQYANTHNSRDEEQRQVKLLMSQNTAGIILAGLEGVEAVNELVRRASCPVVQVVDVGLQTPGVGIAVDHSDAAAAAVRHMIACGYKRIGLVGGSLDERGRRRTDGYSRSMVQAGLYDPNLIHHENATPTTQMGCRLLRRLMRICPDVDAVFCENDDLALGVLFECQRLDKKVPDEFGICGYNDLDFASVTEPPLTTVRIPLFEMGFRAADALVRGVDGRPSEPNTINLGYELIERRTLRRPIGQQ